MPPSAVTLNVSRPGRLADRLPDCRPGRLTFKVTALGGTEWLVVLGLSALSVIGVELAKAAGKLRAKRR